MLVCRYIQFVSSCTQIPFLRVSCLGTWRRGISIALPIISQQRGGWTGGLHFLLLVIASLSSSDFQQHHFRCYTFEIWRNTMVVNPAVWNCCTIIMVCLTVLWKWWEQYCSNKCVVPPTHSGQMKAFLCKTSHCHHSVRIYPPIGSCLLSMHTCSLDTPVHKTIIFLHGSWQ